MFKFLVILLLAASSASCLEDDETPQGGQRFPRRALPSVSRDHYSEVLSDGTYKYAYTGEHRYVAERRLADGTVEGESLFVRPDGVPVKVHYFADKEGYRPKTEVLYNERLISTRTRPSHVVVPSAREVYVAASPPAVVLAPPHSSTGANSVNVNLGGGVTGFRSSNGGQGGDINLNSYGGDVAKASPSVTAIVGPGGQAIIRPESIARTSGSSKYFRGASGSGDVAISNPHVNAIVGAGGSVLVEPKASAFVGSYQPEVVREVHHHTQSVVRSPPEIQRIIEKVHVPFPVETRPQYHRGGYVYDAPRTVIQPAPVLIRPPQAVAVQSSGVILVPPSSKYSYSYGYSAPDPKHPQRDNSAYVNVQVN